MKRAECSVIVPGSNNTSKFVEFDIKINTETFNVFFRCDQPVLSDNYEALLSCALLPAMSAQSNLIVEGEVSQRLITNLPLLQEKYSLWNRSLERIEILKAIPVIRASTANKKIATFFSGGVDSFYTLLKNQEEITDIVFVHGFDIQLEHREYRNRISKNINNIAKHFGKHLIEIETNLRDFLDLFIKYPKWGWNIALVIAGHLLHPFLDKLYEPIGYNRLDLFPSGSRLIPYWSTEGFGFYQDGVEVFRTEKVDFLSTHDFVLENLRVCHKKPSTTLNCGKCEKCIRTMISLEAAGALDKCSTFANGIDMERVLNLDAVNENRRTYLRQNLYALEQNKGDEKLIAVLKKVLERPLWKNTLRKRMRKINKIIKKRF